MASCSTRFRFWRTRPWSAEAWKRTSSSIARSSSSDGPRGWRSGPARSPIAFVASGREELLPAMTPDRAPHRPHRVAGRRGRDDRIAGRRASTSGWRSSPAREDRTPRRNPRPSRDLRHDRRSGDAVGSQRAGDRAHRRARGQTEFLQALSRSIQPAVRHATRCGWLAGRGRASGRMRRRPIRGAALVHRERPHRGHPARKSVARRAAHRCVRFARSANRGAGGVHRAGGPERQAGSRSGGIDRRSDQRPNAASGQAVAFESGRVSEPEGNGDARRRCSTSSPASRRRSTSRKKVTSSSPARRRASDSRAHSAEVVSLGETYRRGHATTVGLSAVILGRPNAGKSTLLNRLVGSDRAIVTPIPGTTRDIVRETIEIGGLPVTLSDTAGLREGADVVEGIGIERARAAARAADLVLYLVDATSGMTEEDRRELALLTNVLVVYTKADLAEPRGRGAGDQRVDRSRHRRSSSATRCARSGAACRVGRLARERAAAGRRFGMRSGAASRAGIGGVRAGRAGDPRGSVPRGERAGVAHGRDHARQTFLPRFSEGSASGSKSILKTRYCERVQNQRRSGGGEVPPIAPG